MAPLVLGWIFLIGSLPAFADSESESQQAGAGSPVGAEVLQAIKDGARDAAEKGGVYNYDADFGSEDVAEKEEQPGAGRQASKPPPVPSANPPVLSAPEGADRPAPQPSNPVAQDAPPPQARPIVQAPPRPRPLPATPEERQLADTKQSALVLYESGRHEEAERLLTQALEKHPNNQDLLSMQKLVGQKVKSDWSAKKFADKAAALFKGGGGPGELQEGPSLASPISFPSPASAAQRAAAGPIAAGRSPLEPFLRRDAARQGAEKMGLKDWSAAELALSQRIKEAPQDPIAYRMRGLARRNLRKPVEALSDFDKALELKPGDRPTRNLRSFVLNDQGRFEEALDSAQELLGENPRDPGALVSRAEALKGLGRGEEALADLKEAARIDPEFDALYREALLSRAQPRFAAPGASKKTLVLGAAGLSLLLVAVGLFGMRGAAATTRRQMRAADRPRVPVGIHVVRQIGEGGMGVVYEATDEGLQRPVALKRMRAELSRDPRELRRFLKEARTVASLRHPNIVEIYTVVEQEDEIFLVFEFVAGKGLDELMGQRGRLPTWEVLALAKQIALALDHAHEQGVVHQDLKPSNVMVAAGIAKVMDFGISRRMLDTLSTMSRQEVVGTPAYMAPEQEHGVCGKEADLFALGVCVYEMLAGRRPYEGAASSFAKLERSFPPLSSLTPELPRAVDAVLGRALSPRPAERHPSARAFVDDLTRALSA